MSFRCWSMLLASVALLANCGDPLTQIVLKVNSDIDESLVGPIQIEVIGPSGRVDVQYTADFTAPGGPGEFPITLGLVLADDATEQGVSVNVVADEANGSERIEASARTNFVLDSTRELAVLLDSSCADVACPENETCFSGSCQDDFTPGEELPVFEE